MPTGPYASLVKFKYDQVAAHRNVRYPNISKPFICNPSLKSKKRNESSGERDKMKGKESPQNKHTLTSKHKQQNTQKEQTPST